MDKSKIIVEYYNEFLKGCMCGLCLENGCDKKLKDLINQYEFLGGTKKELIEKSFLLGVNINLHNLNDSSCVLKYSY